MWPPIFTKNNILHRVMGDTATQWCVLQSYNPKTAACMSTYKTLNIYFKFESLKTILKLKFESSLTVDEHMWI